MRLHPHEFIRRFLLHVLPKGFHRIRHYGLFANANRAENIATARALLHIVPPADPQEQPDITPDALRVLPCPCPTLRRPHDRDRGVRARLRAKLAPDAEHGRHVMTQAYCELATFPPAHSTRVIRISSARLPSRSGLRPFSSRRCAGTSWKDPKT